VADDFVRVRLTRIAGADLNLFEFDYDLTWVCFFLSPDERVYGRYGGRVASGADDRLSLAGLNYAMRSALAQHKAGEKPPPRPEATQRAEQYPAARQSRGCIHCHQVAEFKRDLSQSQSKWDREDRWVYPPPENLGISLDLERADHVKAVAKDSPAAKTGLKDGDVIRRLNGYRVASFGDAQFALHKAPAKGSVPIVWTHESNELSGTIELAAGWRKSNLTWRPSIIELLPSLSLYGDDLTAAEKKALGLAEKRLAFRQGERVQKSLATAGVKAGDVVIGFDGEAMQLTMKEFLGHVRRNYLVGDKVTLNVLRDGVRIDVSLTLK
jgi:serine protease Do